MTIKGIQNPLKHRLVIIGKRCRLVINTKSKCGVMAFKYEDDPLYIEKVKVNGAMGKEKA